MRVWSSHVEGDVGVVMVDEPVDGVVGGTWVVVMVMVMVMVMVVVVMLLLVVVMVVLSTW